MVQAEVAERLAARAGQPGVRGAEREARLVRRGAPGRAGAAGGVLAGARRRLRPARLRPPRRRRPATARAVFAVVDAAFAQRRKALRSALGGLGGFARPRRRPPCARRASTPRPRGDADDRRLRPHRRRPLAGPLARLHRRCWWPARPPRPCRAAPCAGGHRDVVRSVPVDARRSLGDMVDDTGDRSPWPALWALCVGFFMILVDTTIVSVATPTILRGAAHRRRRRRLGHQRLPARLRRAAADHRPPRRPVRPPPRLSRRADRIHRSPRCGAASPARSAASSRPGSCRASAPR